MASPLPINLDLSTVYPTLLIILSIVFFSGITILIIYWIIQLKKYGRYICEIWEFNDEGQLINVYEDKAGVFYDSNTKSRLLFLKNAKTALNPDKIPYFYRNNKRIIYLNKTGEKNYHYINPKIKSGHITLSVGEEDVNWAEGAFERGIKTTSSQDKFTQMLPYIIWALVIVGTLILLIKVMNNIVIIRDVMELLKEVTVELGKARAGTVVVQ